MLAGAGVFLLEVAAGQILQPLTLGLGRYALREAARQIGARADAQTEMVVPSRKSVAVRVADPALDMTVWTTTVISQTPGRARLRVEGLRRDADRAFHIMRRLGRVPGVEAVAANAVTGNILVQYDPNRLTLARIRAALERPRWVGRASGPQRVPAFTRRVAPLSC